MAIRIITGVPGAGKTFYAVKHLRDHYFSYNKKQDIWEIKADITIITNIDSLRLKHLNLDQILSDHGLNIKSFFTVDYQEKIQKKYKKVVYLLDECQRYFPRKFYDEKVFYYFQYHRHLGHDVYLMTQSVSLLPKEIKELSEVEIRAVRRGLSVFGEFKYKVMASGEIIDHKMLKKNKAIFNLYRSMDQKEVEKIKNPLVKYLVLTLILAVIGMWGFKRTFFGGVLNEEKKAIAAGTDTRIEEKKNPRQKPALNHSPGVGNRGDFIPVQINYYKINGRIEIVDYYTQNRIPMGWAEYDIFSQRIGNHLRLWALIPKERYIPKEIIPPEKDKPETAHEPEKKMG